jgi:hypothetical protein
MSTQQNMAGKMGYGLPKLGVIAPNFREFRMHK